MTLKDCLHFILTIVGSVGGTGVIIVSVSRWLSARAAERIKYHFELDFAKQLEEAKTEFARQIETHKSCLKYECYINKVQFDLELVIYKEISEAALRVEEACSDLYTFSVLFSDDNKLKKMKLGEKRCRKAMKAYKKFCESLLAHNAFIPLDLYKDFCALKHEYLDQFDFFEKFFPDEAKNMDVGKGWDENVEISRELSSTLQMLLWRLRAHFKQLDVLDA